MRACVDSVLGALLCIGGGGGGVGGGLRYVFNWRKMNWLCNCLVLLLSSSLSSLLHVCFSFV